MRFFLLPVALLITIGIFLFMQRLIFVDGDALERVELAAEVELYKAPPPEEPEPQKPSEPESSPQEPVMEAVQAQLEAPQAPAESPFPSLAIGNIAIDVGAAGEAWSAPLAGGGGLDGLGQDNSGFVEVVPYTTRQPRVPELAWKNKVNGWVLVVFNVDRRGATKNIRVLDANPRGIFEDSVIEAVRYWRYSIKGIKDYRGDMVLTQRIELNWKDYRPDSGAW